MFIKCSILFKPLEMYFNLFAMASFATNYIWNYIPTVYENTNSYTSYYHKLIGYKLLTCLILNWDETLFHK